MKELNQCSLLDILPDSLTDDENVVNTAKAIDPELQLCAGTVDLPSIYVSIDRLTSLQLDHLALQWDVSVWRDYWPVSLKRSVLKTAIADKRKRGTLKAVKEALSSIGSSASVVEWWQTEPKGTPHTFKIYVTLSDSEGTIEADLQEDVIGLIDDAKPLRSHYDFVLGQTLKSSINAVGVMRVLTIAKLHDGNKQTAKIDDEIGVFISARPFIERHISATAGG